MKIIKLSQASRPLAEYAAELGDEVVVITDRGKTVAAIVPLKPGDQESLVLSNHPGFLALIAQSRREIRAGRSVSLKAMKRQFLAQEWPDTAPQPTSRARTPRVKSRRRTRAARG